ncbi:MAG: sigma-54 dependent transcriptional regulator [Gemmatimonadetes bacterium]|nr:sigma-54 dependent transcriptional regulator [Gemmatimonadota bacterium]
MERILIAEDDRNTREGLVELLSDEGYEVTGVIDGEQAYETARKRHFDILLTDMKMPRVNGLNLIKRVTGTSPETSIIMMTAFATVETAVKAMRDGAFSYLTKPLKVEELLATIQGALQEKQNRRRMEASPGTSSIPDPEIIGESDQIRGIFERVEKVARANTTVLLLGESGTGKSLIARAIHAKSYRRDRPFVDVSCASIPEGLLESELFGTEKGAYTGALNTTRKGYFERAAGGTIFLDEIGEISGTVQVKLLRVLQERRFERLGGTEPLDIDVRVVAATNRNLEDAEGRYRQELYYRLNVIPILVPPLRDHRDDIPPLIDYFIRKYTEENGLGDKSISDDALEICMGYDWPGNIREVENAIESAVVLSDGERILPEHLPNLAHAPPIVSNPGPVQGTLKDSRGQAEKLLIQQALRESGGNRTRAAEALGVTVRTIQYKIKKYDL